MKYAELERTIENQARKLLLYRDGYCLDEICGMMKKCRSELPAPMMLRLACRVNRLGTNSINISI
jgi:hypothetical protein